MDVDCRVLDGWDYVASDIVEVYENRLGFGGSGYESPDGHNPFFLAFGYFARDRNMVV